MKSLNIFKSKEVNNLEVVKGGVFGAVAAMNNTKQSNESDSLEENGFSETKFDLHAEY